MSMAMPPYARRMARRHTHTHANAMRLRQSCRRMEGDIPRLPRTHTGTTSHFLFFSAVTQRKKNLPSSSSLNLATWPSASFLFSVSFTTAFVASHSSQVKPNFSRMLVRKSTVFSRKLATVAAIPP